VAIATGSLIWGVAAAIGISALLSASTAAYTTLRIIGAGYMIWLGLRMIWASAVGQFSAVDTEESASPAASSGWRSWCQGLLTNLLNPKIGAFYLSMLPQFIPAHASPLVMGLLLALVHDLEGMMWFALIILGTHGIRDRLRRRSVQRSVDGLTGTVLIGFGLKLGLFARS
jgi:threonine/homoserine/homoserine lactone efflux protein